MAVNKVVYNTENGAETLIDLTSDTVTPETLAVGATAHDASGNIINGTLPTDVMWDDVKNKPFTTSYSTTLTCDGRTGDLIHVDDWYKVSDVTPAVGDLTNGMTVDLGFTSSEAGYTEISDDVTGITAWNNVFAVVIRTANATYNNLTFPEPGIYYEYNLMGGRTTYLTINYYACFPLDTLNASSLPTHSHGWDDITDTGKEEAISAVKDSFATETWTFELEDGTTVTKQMVFK